MVELNGSRHQRQDAQALALPGAQPSEEVALFRDPNISASAATEVWFFSPTLHVRQGPAVPLLHVVRDPGGWRGLCLGFF